MSSDNFYKKGFEMFQQIEKGERKLSNKEVVYGLYKEYPHIFCDIIERYTTPVGATSIEVKHVVPTQESKLINGYPTYSNEEIEIIKTKYPSLTGREVADIINKTIFNGESVRTPNAICAKAKILKLYKKSEIKQKVENLKIIKNVCSSRPRTLNRFSKDETTFVLQMAIEKHDHDFISNMCNMKFHGGKKIRNKTSIKNKINYMITNN